MSSICLVIIFNHRFDANIPKLKKVYGNKFSNIKFLVPFYDGNDENVIPVFESSYQFQGFLIQGLRDIYEENIDYYIFIADDMLLNPIFTENNIIEKFSLRGNDAFITSIGPLNTKHMFTAWNHTRHSARPFTRPDTNYRENLMKYEDALKKMKNFFGDYSEYYQDSFFEDKRTGEIDYIKRDAFVKDNGGTNKINYPLARGYSDFFILNKTNIKKVAYTCGVFAAMNLFVEIALPTSMILHCEDVITMNDITYEAKLMWTKEEIDKLLQENENDISNLLHNMSKEIAFYHPIKFSKWKL